MEHGISSSVATTTVKKNADISDFTAELQNPDAKTEPFPGKTKPSSLPRCQTVVEVRHHLGRFVQ